MSQAQISMSMSSVITSETALSTGSLEVKPATGSLVLASGSQVSLLRTGGQELSQKPLSLEQLIAASRSMPFYGYIKGRVHPRKKRKDKEEDVFFTQLKVLLEWSQTFSDDEKEEQQKKKKRKNEELFQLLLKKAKECLLTKGSKPTKKHRASRSYNHKSYSSIDSQFSSY